MYTTWLLLILNICVAFIMLYPFYLRDKKPSKYRGIWFIIGDFLKDRHGAVWMLIILLGGLIFNISAYYIQGPLLYTLLIIGYMIFSVTVLLYPYHLKYKTPERYVGLWKSMGEWMGEPLIAIPRRKN
ncbi:MAG: hypothetical protein ACOY46_01515 [Bacillota bacterium]